MKRMAFTQKKFAEQLPADPPNPDGRNDNVELWSADPERQNLKVGRKRLKRKGENTLVVLFNPDLPRLHEKINGMIYLVRVCFFFSFFSLLFIFLFILFIYLFIYLF